MPEQPQAQTSAAGEGSSPAPQPLLHVAPGPHARSGRLTTRRMMLDVLIGLLPVFVAAVVVFQWLAVVQAALAVASCLAAEWILTRLRGRRASLGDLSAVVTGMILAFSLPAIAPWYVTVLGGFAAIGLGKFIFGGLGQNLFNPAMVGRAFVMIAFTQALAAGGYVSSERYDPWPMLPTPDAVTAATPMTAIQDAADPHVTPLAELVLGTTNGSLGETSAIACLIGGLYLLIRRTAAWQIPAGMLAAAAVCGVLTNNQPQPGWTILHQLSGGALLFGAFFIATDPVSSPLTPKGRWIYGIGAGLLVVLMRYLSAYPEGVMFSVLLMNSLVPLINRWTIPRPWGGRVGEAARG